MLLALETHAQRPESTPTIITFEVPGAGTGAGQGSNPIGINSAGTITGLYTDASNVSHGFLRAADGTITTFDAPAAGTGAGQGTFPNSINTAGDTAGYYYDASNVHHGFVRAADGSIATFDCPDAGNHRRHNGLQCAGRRHRRRAGHERQFH